LDIEGNGWILGARPFSNLILGEREAGSAKFSGEEWLSELRKMVTVTSYKTRTFYIPVIEN
jgi:hypothetical protein